METSLIGKALGFGSNEYRFESCVSNINYFYSNSYLVSTYLSPLCMLFIVCCGYLIVINFIPPRTTWNNYTPVNLLTAELLGTLGGCIFLILFKKSYFLPMCLGVTNKQNFAETMGNSSSTGGYSPGHNIEESNINSTKTLNENLEKYPAPAKKDKEQVWSSTMEIAKAGAKGCVTGASITSVYNKDYRACAAGAGMGVLDTQKMQQSPN